MSDTTANLALPLIAAAQAQKHVTHNEALTDLDALVQLACLDKDRASPPADPAEGDRYLVLSPTPTGAWAGLSGQIACFRDGHWRGFPPKPGWLAWVVDEGDLYAYSGTGWTGFRATLTALQNLARFGLGTQADATNPFAAKLNKALWTALTTQEGGTGDLRYALNKQAPGNVLSLLFQSGFSGRAELGLTGDDDLTLKVSPDGVTFREALRVDAAGHLGLGTAAPRTRLDTGLGTLSGAANDYGKAQTMMSGGGTVTWAGPGGRFYWAGRMICIPMSRATASVGYIDISMRPPGSTIPAALVSDGITRTWTEAGIVLNNWEALWAIHKPGGNQVEIDFAITHFSGAANTPSNWLLIAACNGEDGALKLGLGPTVPAGGSWAPGLGAFDSVVTKGAAAFGGSVAHTRDNAFSFGTPAARAAVVYAATGSINTSDAREKTPVEPLTGAQLAAASALAREIGTFRFLDAVAAKGGGARLHVGLTVQRAIAVMEAHGVDPLALGIVCHDSWEAIDPVPARAAQVPEPDAEGTDLAPAIPAQPARPGAPAGDRYGFRPDELLLFLARGFDARLSALEASAQIAGGA